MRATTTRQLPRGLASTVALVLAGLTVSSATTTPAAFAGFTTSATVTTARAAARPAPGATAVVASTTAAPARCQNVRVSPTDDVRLATEAVICLLNDERSARRLRPLHSNASLTHAAIGHSQDMVRRRYFAHTGPGHVTFDRRIRRARYRAGARSKLGENLAWGMGSPSLPIEIVHDWMISPEHRANILDPDFRSIGIGIARGVPVNFASSAAGTGATYTTDFGSR
jgi:uncharacterized protein YkwD